MGFRGSRVRIPASRPTRRFALSRDLRLRRTGERLACWLDRSPDLPQARSSRGVRLLLAFARRLLTPRTRAWSLRDADSEPRELLFLAVVWALHSDTFSRS